ncbi:Fic family protein [Arundinibacter roseus]|uniref:Fic family protein n=1 Tax=Arundinibacter roseus TaxID=2070510 RepID=A0A4R4KQT8_9BACT|nr:Fic family protein [Arundinibacter roseus]TDB68999.1 Fic family protein [Arundinibacter roseus]
MISNLSLLKTELLPVYLQQIPNGLKEAFDALQDAEISTDTFSFYRSVSAVFSSKIEGEEIELDSFVKHKKFGIEFLPDYTRKIDDLYSAYTFAQSKILNNENVAKAHRILGRNIVARQWQGNYRNMNMYVSTPDGRIEYVAVSPFEVASEMAKFYNDVSILLDAQLSSEEIFFYAAMIHLVFVKIHPWNDGNGRCARLLEKWFLAQKLGEKAWFIQSERMYYQQHQTYYKNLRMLGLEYPELEYNRALPFLLMLPNALFDC